MTQYLIVAECVSKRRIATGMKNEAMRLIDLKGTQTEADIFITQNRNLLDWGERFLILEVNVTFIGKMKGEE